MAHYLVVHALTKLPESQDEWLLDWKGMRMRARGEKPGEAHWLTSWYSATAQKLYCEWEAPSEAAIRACFTPEELRMAPIRQVEEVVRADPAWLD